MGPESKFVSNFSLIFSSHWKLRKKVCPLNKLVGNTADFVDNECTMYPNDEKNHFFKKASTLNNLDLYWVADLRKNFSFFQRSPLALDMFAFVIFAFSLLEKLLTLVPKISNSSGRKFDIVISVSFQLHV